jgi:hypothetical protein
MPLVPNVFYDLGLGPATLRDASLLRMRAATMPFWFVITYVGFVGAVALLHATLVAVGKTLKLLAPGRPGNRELLVLLLACELIYVVPVAILISTGEAFDRYVLFLVPLAIATVILLVSDISPGRTRSPVMALAVGSLLLYGAFATAGTHDYLSWNRARWQALENLMTEQRLSASEIDGGYEFNGWCLPDSKARATKVESLWWVDHDDFLVTFGPVQGFTEFSRYPYRRWIPPAEGHLLVLRRAERNPPGS